MTATMTAGTKTPRKQLSHELDRLDGIIDLLADALPGAVADAARDGVRQAVREALAEAIASPELRTLLAQATTPAPVVPPRAEPAPPTPSVWTRIRAKLTDLRSRVESATISIALFILTKCLAAKPAVESAVRSVRSAWRPRYVTLLAMTAGLVTAAGCYAAPRVVSAAVSGLTGVGVTLKARAWTRPLRG